MTVSVIIPMYNSAATIDKALDSVLAQTFEAHYRIIVVDDGSQDDSARIVEDYAAAHPGADITLIRKPNGGASSARNVGLKAATGEWVALLDSDDRWLPEKTERQMEQLSRNPDIDALGCNVTSWEARLFGFKKKKVAPVKLWHEFVSWHPSTPTMIFKRDIVDVVGYYDEDMTHSEDGMFLIRILIKKNCWFMPDRLVEVGGGKPAFGYSGLSANLNAMLEGQMRILDFVYENRGIGPLQYMFFRVFATVKHWRRVMITRFR